MTRLTPVTHKLIRSKLEGPRLRTRAVILQGSVRQRAVGRGGRFVVPHQEKRTVTGATSPAAITIRHTGQRGRDQAQPARPLALTTVGPSQATPSPTRCGMRSGWARSPAAIPPGCGAGAETRLTLAARPSAVAHWASMQRSSGPVTPGRYMPPPPPPSPPLSRGYSVLLS
jgi:hypothetical protein